MLFPAAIDTCSPHTHLACLLPPFTLVLPTLTHRYDATILVLSSYSGWGIAGTNVVFKPEEGGTGSVDTVAASPPPSATLLAGGNSSSSDPDGSSSRASSSASGSSNGTSLGGGGGSPNTPSNLLAVEVAVPVAVTALLLGIAMAWWAYV